jgi:phosphatidylserine/phosphatidylglycerophosphate/cardiolipin synthase-like enzyme
MANSVLIDGSTGSSNTSYVFTKDHPEKTLVSLIGEAKSTLDIAIYSLTHPDIVQAIKDAKARGVVVRVITDKIQASGKSQTEALKILGSAGIPTMINSHSGLMHLKVTLVDNKIATSGSYNYSKAASTVNDEVLIVMRNESIAKSFSTEFDTMWKDTNNFTKIEKSIAMDDSAADPAIKTDEVKLSAQCDLPTIKGNLSSAGEKIYHVPGGAFYDRTVAEQMFCSAEEAQAAGFRASSR